MSNFEIIYQLALTAKNSQELKKNISSKIPLAIPYEPWKNYDFINVNGINFFQTPAFRLAFEGHLKAVELLIEIGAEPVEAIYGLIRAARYKEALQFQEKYNFQLVRNLPSHQKQEDREKQLKLLGAVLNQDVPVLKEMVQDSSYHSHIVNTRYNALGEVLQNFTLLHVAVRYKVSVENITLLLRVGANLSDCDVNNRTPYELAEVYKHKEISELLANTYYQELARLSNLKFLLPLQIATKIENILGQIDLLKAKGEPLEHLTPVLKNTYAFLYNQMSLESYQEFAQTLQGKSSLEWQILGGIMMCLGGVVLGLGFISGGSILVIGALAIAGVSLMGTGISFFSKKSTTGLSIAIDDLYEDSNTSLSRQAIPT
jgi:hypothetical protein